MNQLNVIHDGALLIRNGVIDEVGSARRVENLAASRKAREIDVSGRIVMPAFVDPDGVLIAPGPGARAEPSGPEPNDTHWQRSRHLRVLSRRVVEVGALGLASEWARSGVLSMGAHTGYASSLKDTVKILRVHRSLEGKPMRIRSIFSPHPAAIADTAASSFIDDLDAKWLPMIRRRKLAAIVEFSACAEDGGFYAEQLRAAAVAAADHGFSIRIRCIGPAEESLHALAVQAGVISWIGFPSQRISAASLDFGGAYVLPVSDSLTDVSNQMRNVRHAIDKGIPIALASDSRMDGPRSANPQFLLYLARERFGLSCEEAIMASTYNAACSLKMSHVTGSLEPGKAADLLVMDVPDYHELVRRVGHNDVNLVLRAGQPVYRRAQINLPARDKPEP